MAAIDDLALAVTALTAQVAMSVVAIQDLRAQVAAIPGSSDAAIAAAVVEIQAATTSLAAA